MQISFRSKLFDTISDKADDSFYGQDIANLVSKKLLDWKTDVFEEDWGWCILASKRNYNYIIGVYDHDVDDVNELGSLWYIRLFNENDNSNWLKKLFKHIPPKAHEEVVAEIDMILKESKDVKDIHIEPLE